VSDENSQAAYHRFPLHWPEPKLEMNQASETPSTWLSHRDGGIWMHPPEPGKLQILVMGRPFFESEFLGGKDTLRFERAQLPTGRLDVLYQQNGTAEYYWEVIRNYPQLIQPIDQISLRIRAGI
jgi:hypothetical protein